MAAPLVVQSRVTNAKSTSVNVSYPSSMTSGNRVIFAIGWVDDAAPVSYTGSKLTYIGGIDNDQNDRANLYAYYRDIDGTEGASENFDFGSDRECTAIVVEVSGQDTEVAPLGAFATTGGSRTNNPDPPSRAWGWSGDTLALAGFVFRENSTVSGQPSGYSQITSGSISGKALHVISEKDVTSSPENPGTFSCSDSRTATTYTLVIKSAGGTTFERATAVASVSTVTAASVKSSSRAATVSGVSALTATATKSTSRATSMSSTSSVSVLAIKSINRVVDVSSTSTISSSAAKTSSRVVGVSGASVVSALAVRFIRRAVAISGVSSLSVSGSAPQSRTVSVTSVSAASASAFLTRRRAVSISSESVVTAQGIKSVNRAAAITSASSLTVVGRRTLIRAVTLTGGSTVTGSAVRVFNRPVGISATSLLNAVYSGAVTSRAVAINSASTITLSSVIVRMTGRNLGTTVYVDGENRQTLVTAEPNEVTRSVRVDQENRSAMVSTRRNAA